MNDVKCVCEGNWRELVNECSPLFGRTYKLDKEYWKMFQCENDSVTYRFIGILWGEDDFYYCMMAQNGQVHRLSCVGDIEGWGFVLQPESETTQPSP